MASATPGPSTSGSASTGDLLYNQCEKTALECEEKYRKAFGQDELLDLCKKADLTTITDAVRLLSVVNTLTANNLFLPGKSRGGALCWSLRPRDIATRLTKLSNEDRMVYVLVEETQANGVWVRQLKKKTGMSDQAIAKSTDKLAKMILIKAVRNIRAPAQKTFMLAHLAPNDDVTGGSFYDAGELDESLVEELCNMIVFHVRQTSWVEVKRKKIKRDPGEAVTIDDEGVAVAEEGRGRKKRKTAHGNDIEDSAPARKAHRGQTEYVWLSRPANHEYPTTAEIHRFIISNNFMRTSKAESMTVDETQNLINMLIWDNKLERINGGYRTVRGVKPKEMGEDSEDEGEDAVNSVAAIRKRGNGLTEMPCGRCPVIDICGKGGPINAATCVYFEQWLNVAVDVPSAQGPGSSARHAVEIAG